MNWFKAVLVLFVVHVESSQGSTNNPYNAENNSTVQCLQKNLEAQACWQEDILFLNVTIKNNNYVIEKIENANETENCTQFLKQNETAYSLINSSVCTTYAIVSEYNDVLYINSSEFSKASKCPQYSAVCIANNLVPVTCPLKNFQVKPLFNEADRYINLNMSWDPSEIKHLVNIMFHPKNGPNFKSGCLAEPKPYLSQSLLKNTNIKPGHLVHESFAPGCSYDIIIKGQETKYGIFCNYTYTIPDCAIKSAKLTKIEHISEDKFLVGWKVYSTKNETSVLKNIRFTYRKVNSDISKDAKVQNRFLNNNSEIVMRLVEEENYVIEGHFEENMFSCAEVATMKYQAPIVTTSTNTFVIVACVLIGLGVAVLLAFRFKSVAKYKNKALNLFSANRRQAEFDALLQIQLGQFPMQNNPQYTAAEILERSCDDYEFPRNKLVIQDAIGEGAFGRVYSAKALGIRGCTGHKIVAVKTLGDSEYISKDELDDFLSEIAIFKKIGKYGNHPNIVALLGCCTLEQPFIMIMEFVACGDLKEYLLDLRKQWRKARQKEKTHIFSQNSDGAYIDSPATPLTPFHKTQRFFPDTPTPLTPVSPAQKNAQHFIFPESSERGYLQLDSMPTTPESVTTSRLPSSSETVMTPLDDAESPAPKYTLEKVLDHKELQNFALQIACGMSHLEKIPITHRDLAARNILISEYKVLKISDFGLSRTGPYTNSKTRKLPLRWMAIESITEQKYDSKTDVWSFGVVLWEIGTLGAFPYESVQDALLLQFLQMGGRLQRPEICTDELYNVMTECWASDPADRPTFKDLVDVLDVKKKKAYVDFDKLNPTYVFPPSEKECS